MDELQALKDISRLLNQFEKISSYTCLSANRSGCHVDTEWFISKIKPSESVISKRESADIPYEAALKGEDYNVYTILTEEEYSRWVKQNNGEHLNNEKQQQSKETV